ncbi:MAG: hypothetical protein A3A43_01830 [Candidatus Liptonbacteria bacterium RIFCSPLOWO2_01_FULL_56_20]|uniref:Uncharacterized protein n=1 Tax=Candidatus Liptonbacteria bacterium RIFCSPLOWO2_01_FULL_56_20 TaxID=1798652 RepID=A0A1G2CHP0_9BACT|nr:MAG: hypothetical protein A2681_01905 [Candidatus Liptonbacteria bacterium RIFCSPHIGHO2_01_FULL_56_18b]OGZ00906.1 MAG: hypothetical protein A3A43_01830 [Candidatus Liptonbacteria bacterium RIFCSPLOWO2_01_FULL_56_20]
MGTILNKTKEAFKDPVFVFVVLPIIAGIVIAVYYFLDATYWNPGDYGPGTAEDQTYELQDLNDFYAP